MANLDGDSIYSPQERNRVDETYAIVRVVWALEQHGFIVALISTGVMKIKMLFFRNNGDQFLQVKHILTVENCILQNYGGLFITSN
ncbi:uncharacterized protein LOC111286185 isoform X2 [Durio zibethinus]|uniref:Uncharacterized protein LOC111286185 isoform X2 n=1 Tax=Durio zibethinus TaxID=66656 RepID=A0A6P5XU66_DURZI|nr:uncharacterized protein LOC111286185 isoform X2 [Durio zibethinus]